MKPTISIIVPVYNVEAYLNNCLDSIRAQIFTNFEVILVNDGSTDASGAICDDYVEKDERFHVIHQVNEGVSSARNVGVSRAKGSFIGFVDGDDYIDKNMYQILYTLCLTKNSDIAICKLGRSINGQLINNYSDEKNIKEFNNLEAMRELFKGVLYRFSLCNKLFSKKCFEHIYFPVGRIHEDLSTTYKLMASANKVVYINYLGYIYVKQKNSILTTIYSQKRLDAFIGWNEILDFMDRHYTELTDEFISSFTYWCIDNIYLIMKQVHNKREKIRFVNVIQSYIRKYYWEIARNKHVSLKYKYLVTVISLHAKLFLFSNQVKKLTRRNKRGINSSNA